MYSKAQFDINEQNKAIISFKVSSDVEDVRDKMAKRFFESIDHNSFLRMEYDHITSVNGEDGRIHTTQLKGGTIFPVSEHEILGYLSQDIDPFKEMRIPNIDEDHHVIEAGKDEDPRVMIFDYIREKAGITDFHTLLKLSQLIGYKMGTTPFHNYGYDPQKIIFSIVLEQEREYFPIVITGQR